MDNEEVEGKCFRFFLGFDEMGSTDCVPTDTSFSIRDYVLSAREKDIHNNWPFQEKYLDVCLKHGLIKVLPSFKSLHSMRDNPNNEHAQSDYSQAENAHTKIDTETELVEIGTNICIEEAVSEITMQMFPLSLSSDKSKQVDSGGSSKRILHPLGTKVPYSILESSSECQTDQLFLGVAPSKNNKQGKRKEKHRKRLLADIYTETKPCSLEDLDCDIGYSPCESWTRKHPRDGNDGICDYLGGGTKGLEDQVQCRNSPVLTTKQSLGRD